MAGSYDHVVTAEGNLRSPESMAGMIELRTGDVYEAVEEMYGMIWYLAKMVSAVCPQDSVESARRNYEEGLKFAKETKNKKKDA